MMISLSELQKAYEDCMEGADSPEMIYWECPEGCGLFVLPDDKDRICEHLKKMLADARAKV